MLLRGKIITGIELALYCFYLFLIMIRFSIQYLLLLTSIGFLSGCSFEPYYQLFTIDTERAEKLTDGLVYQDERCSLIYNLWGDGGNAQFQFKNNSESDLVILKNHSFWVLNGQAFPLYQGRVWGQAQSQALVFSSRTKPVLPAGSIDNISSSSGSMESVERIEMVEQVVPAGLYVNVESGRIHNTIHDQCRILEWKQNKEGLIQTYEQETSPLKFHHLVRYTDGRDTFEISSKFHIKQIKTVREREAMEMVSSNPCGEQITDWGYIRRLKYLGPNAFFLKFNLE